MDVSVIIFTDIVTLRNAYLSSRLARFVFKFGRFPPHSFFQRQSNRIRINNQFDSISSSHPSSETRIHSDTSSISKKTKVSRQTRRNEFSTSDKQNSYVTNADRFPVLPSFYYRNLPAVHDFTKQTLFYRTKVRIF